MKKEVKKIGIEQIETKGPIHPLTLSKSVKNTPTSALQVVG